ncbi:MAG TPA: hypothetical protein PLN21_13300 [Gemmatales bacterium]|nr:hypothetical protein [Gemmatales bacterium]
MSPKLKIVELKARDWQATVEWFCHYFSMNVLIMDHVKQYALLGEDYGTEANLSVRGTTETFTGSQFLLQWEVNDLVGLVANLAHRGIRVLKPIQEASDEWYKRAIIEGPEGVPLLLFEFDNCDTIEMTEHDRE